MSKTPFMAAIAGLAVLLAAAGAAGAKGDKRLVETEGLLAAALEGPLADVRTVLFAVRPLAGDLHYYENYGRRYGESCIRGEGGTRLCVLDLRTRKVRDILTDGDGAVRDPQLSYDGRRALISYRPGGTDRFHLYEVDLGDGRLRRITGGPFDDVEPTYLPDGGIAFISSRCKRRVPCWSSQVGLLYRCEADGSGIRRISAGVEHENTPWPLPDGRLLYTRWEYVDRDEVAFHHLWTANPDGTRHMTFYGNMHKHGNAVAMLDAKPIPGRRSVVCTYAFHNTPEHAGDVVVIDPAAGPDHEPAARVLTDSYPEPIRKKSKYGVHKWRDPYPVGGGIYLVAAQKTLYVMDDAGRAEALHTLADDNPRMWLHEPRPMHPRPREPVLTDTTDRTRTTGTLVCYDVTSGRNMPGVGRGEIARLLVMEELPKPVSFRVDPDLVSLESTFILHRILGTVPVAADGSAHFRVPADRPLFLVALDANDQAVKRMMSFVTVAPGETTGCVGCHEPRTRTPPQSPRPHPAALKRPPSRIRPVPGVPDVIDYPRDIQPIWDRHCVRCHNYEKYAGHLSLTGELAPEFTHSYLNLFWAGLISHGQQGMGNRGPRSIGAVASPLCRKLRAGHKNVKLSDEELRTVEMWVESSAAFAGTYGALRRAVPSVRGVEDIRRRRCGGCHKPGELPHRWRTGRGRLTGRWYNLSRPERSLALLAPLAEDAGGLGLCAQREAGAADRYKGDDPPANVFASRNDPDYRALKAAIDSAAERAAAMKPYPMKGWRPTGQYLDEMRRFGILPDDFERPVNPYRLDRAYWRSFYPAEDASTTDGGDAE